MQIYTICSRVTGILILIGSLGCLKEVKTMDIILGKCKFPNNFLSFFKVTYVVYQCVPSTYVFSINEVFAISF